MADTKEALPVVAWARATAGGLAVCYMQKEPPEHAPWAGGEGAWTPLTDHATATAAIAELRAEVERLKAAVDKWRDQADMFQSILSAAEIVVTGTPQGWYWERKDSAARGGASGGATENKPSQPHESNPERP